MLEQLIRLYLTDDESNIIRPIIDATDEQKDKIALAAMQNEEFHGDLIECMISDNGLFNSMKTSEKEGEYTAIESIKERLYSCQEHRIQELIDRMNGHE